MQNKVLNPQAEKNKQKVVEKKDLSLAKKEATLNKMTDEEIMAELKQKGLQTFGTKQEKLDRLKKYYGIISTPSVKASIEMDKVEDPISKKKELPKSNVVDKIEEMKQKREERRLKMEEIKREKAEREAEHEAAGKNTDVEFEMMVEKFRFKQPLLSEHTPSSQLKLCVCVRKRPIFKKEQANGEIDAVSCANPQMMVHECKFKVDGITKYVDNSNFTFDNAFNEHESNQDIYNYSVGPHVEYILNQGIVTCFAYGQTGSGKTFTMKGIQELVIQDLYKQVNTKYKYLLIS